MMTVGQNLILGLISGLAAGLRSLGAAAVTVGTNAVISVRNGIIGQLRGLSSTALSIRNVVIETLASSGTWLYNIGRNIIYGLYNGIVSLGSWLYNKILAFYPGHRPGADPVRAGHLVAVEGHRRARPLRGPRPGGRHGGRHQGRCGRRVRPGRRGRAGDRPAAEHELAEAGTGRPGPAAGARAGLERAAPRGTRSSTGSASNIRIKWRGDPGAAFGS
jgi:hypothetical protein